MCSVRKEEFLIASHIKPWKDSNKYEKLDSDNGLLLCPNHDKLFDSGYISFDDDGKIIISAQLSDVEKRFMNVNEYMEIEVQANMGEYIKYHRNHVYKG